MWQHRRTGGERLGTGEGGKGRQHLYSYEVYTYNTTATVGPRSRWGVPTGDVRDLAVGLGLVGEQISSSKWLGRLEFTSTPPLRFPVYIFLHLEAQRIGPSLRKFHFFQDSHGLRDFGAGHVASRM